MIKNLTLLEILQDEKNFLLSSECKKLVRFDDKTIQIQTKAYNEILEQIKMITHREFILKYRKCLDESSKFSDIISSGLKLDEKQQERYTYIGVFEDILVKINKKYVYDNISDTISDKKMSEIAILDMLIDNYSNDEYSSKKAYLEMLLDMEYLSKQQFLKKYIDIILSLSKEFEQFSHNDFYENSKANSLVNYNNEIVKLLERINMKYKYADILETVYFE